MASDPKKLLAESRDIGGTLEGLRENFAKAPSYHRAVLIQIAKRERAVVVSKLRSQIKVAYTRGEHGG